MRCGQITVIQKGGRPYLRAVSQGYEWLMPATDAQAELFHEYWVHRPDSEYPTMPREFWSRTDTVLQAQQGRPSIRHQVENHKAEYRARVQQELTAMLNTEGVGWAEKAQVGYNFMQDKFPA